MYVPSPVRRSSLAVSLLTQPRYLLSGLIIDFHALRRGPLPNISTVHDKMTLPGPMASSGHDRTRARPWTQPPEHPGTLELERRCICNNAALLASTAVVRHRLRMGYLE